MIIQQVLWRRLYRHESLTERSWSWATRGLRDILIRIPETLDGVVLKSTLDPVKDSHRRARDPVERPQAGRDGNPLPAE